LSYAKVVPPEGPTDSPLALIGDFPRWKDVSYGRPFAGDDGKLLNMVLEEAGLRRFSLLISNVCDTRPPRDEWALFSESEIDDNTNALSKLLSICPRRIIVAFGPHAFWTAATGEPAPRSEKALNNFLAKRFGGTITELRGYVFDGPFGAVMAAVHPAFVLRSWLPWRATLTWDLQKAKRWVDKGNLHPVLHQSHYVKAASEAALVVQYLLKAPMLAVDSEEPPDACVAFAASPQEGISLLWPRDRECIAELLAAPMPKVLQNAQYDLTKFHNYGLQVNGEIHDTMLAWFAKDPLIAGKSSDSGARQSAKSLRFLASIFTDEPFWKDYKFQTPEDKWRLCATDARITLEVLLQLLPEFAARSNGNEQARNQSQRYVTETAHTGIVGRGGQAGHIIRAIRRS
jgi:uracil-DNA glycosylase family 4